jgi:hypothetical protein
MYRLRIALVRATLSKVQSSSNALRIIHLANRAKKAVVTTMFRSVKSVT